MTFDEFLSNLAFGEFTNFAMQDENFQFNGSDRARLVKWTNQGLKLLCSKFCIKKNEVIIELDPIITRYYLRPENSRVSGSSNYRYLMDAPTNPFQADVVKILEVRDSSSYLLPLNEKGNMNSLMTPEFDCLYVPSPSTGDKIGVVYQALHPLIGDPTVTVGCYDEINITPVLEEALMCYIASKGYSQMGGQENIANAQRLDARFNEICASVSMEDQTGSSEIGQNNKLHSRGYV